MKLAPSLIAIAVASGLLASCAVPPPLSAEDKAVRLASTLLLETK
jgi:hypothetical protein